MRHAHLSGQMENEIRAGLEGEGEMKLAAGLGTTFSTTDCTKFSSVMSPCSRGITDKKKDKMARITV